MRTNRSGSSADSRLDMVCCFEIGLALAVQFDVVVLRLGVIQPVHRNDVHAGAILHHDALQMLLRGAVPQWPAPPLEHPGPGRGVSRPAAGARAPGLFRSAPG